MTRIGNQSAAVAGVNLHNWCTKILKEIGEESLQAITRENVGGWFTHSHTFFFKSCQWVRFVADLVFILFG